MPIHRLLDLMAHLRHPDRGCPWDVAQDFATIAPYTIEEAYEVADAIARDDLAALRDELGDLLLQVVFHAEMAREREAFAFADVVTAICDKLVRRHPHVFGGAGGDGGAPVASAADQTAAWERLKAAERAGKAGAENTSVLDDIPLALPALTRAAKLQKRAAGVGFDWPTPAQALAKVAEEVAELAAEMAAAGDRQDRLADELGDLLFACVNVARKLAIDPEAALRQANGKFERRFRAIEAALAAAGRTPGDGDLAELDRLWDRVKAAERSGSAQPADEA